MLKMVEKTVQDLKEDSSDEEHETVEIYKELVEIDARAS